MITVESEYEGNHFSATVSTLTDAYKVCDLKTADGAKNVHILIDGKRLDSDEVKNGIAW